MKSNEFRKWLMSGYRPPLEVADDGGYWVPKRILVDKRGWIYQAFRVIGWGLRSKAIYMIGAKFINPQEEIEKHFHAEIERKFLNGSGDKKPRGFIKDG